MNGFKKFRMNESEYVDNTCAGKEIRWAMALLSQRLLDYCEHFARKSKQSNSVNEIMRSNIVCVFLSVSCIEAKINEIIKIHNKIEFHQIWHALGTIQSKLGLKDKWNMIAALVKGREWDAKKEPFLSFSVIQSLRNEIVHYKAEPMGKDEVPTSKIKRLFNHFGIKSSASFVEDDVFTWLDDLLAVRDLGWWIFDKVKKLFNLADKELFKMPSWIKKSDIE